MSLVLLLLLSMALLVTFGLLRAAEPEPAATGMDPKVTEAMQPGPEHHRLARLAGSWDVSCSMRMGPEMPVMESQAMAVFRTILDGRFLQADFTGSFQDRPFTGLSLMGYDRAAKQYISTWCDSMATSFVCLTGTSSDGGRTITYGGEMICPLLGRTRMRQVETHEDDDRFTLVMHQTPEGREEFQSMELTYRRRR